MTLATGSRGASTREIFKDPANIPGCEGQPSPCGVVVALGEPRRRLRRSGGGLRPTASAACPGSRRRSSPAPTRSRAAGCRPSATWPAATTSTSSAPTTSPSSASRSIPTRSRSSPIPTSKNPTSAFVATGPEVYNEAFMWGAEERHAGRPAAAAQRRRQQQEGAADRHRAGDQPDAGTEHRAPTRSRTCGPYRIPGTKAKMSFATSLPAFVYNGGPVTPFGEAPGPGIDPCADTAEVLHVLPRRARHEPRHAGRGEPRRLGDARASWQPLEWMSSTWRSSADPTVDFDYNVTPHMVGNLADLPFDGQTAITQRGLKGPRGVKPAKAKCNYVGDDRFLPEDPAEYQVYAGAEARVPRPRAVGGPGRPARRSCARSAPRSRPAPAIRARTTTSRRPSSPTCRTRRFRTATTAADRRSAVPGAPMRDHRVMENGSQPLRDAHGRSISDLRVSVTDRCNFRCQYCMPADGLPWLERDEVLSFEEIERLVAPAGRARDRGRAPDRRRAARPPRVPEPGRDAGGDRRASATSR